jgi:NAD(P)-dependent dehydrogenase (short-subunit alcohol dehydrogenase family)
MSEPRRTALVTGASRGIGREIALAFGRAGFDVAFTARTVHEGDGRVPPRNRGAVPASDVPVAGSLDATAAALDALGVRTLAVPMDLLSPTGVTAAADLVLAEFGHLDVLVNNAIAHLPGTHDPLLAVEPDTLTQALTANFVHQLVLVQRVLPSMLARGSGVVIDLCSGSATTDPRAAPDAGGWGLAYSSSKAAFGRIAGAINAEYRTRGVRAFNLDPGFVVTEAAAARGGTADIAARGFDAAPPQAAAAAAVHLATSPDADRLLGKVVWAPKLVADLGLLDL